ncbi:hypothetical protein AT15_07370 [Kosmotoga arenicorallina S304]|uniref:Uncharacterized protein n=1 Tax=Kosmotoga arenicorallina S304 TaxID=1453497 RepID=A0A176K2Q7_9BACT|nr:hypothetical protein [Kosmotoga arenicorallina]OAA31308.1 hypothetical protein AT15_07370 [Kosmotoga arenicorallina S304]
MREDLFERFFEFVINEDINPDSLNSEKIIRLLKEHFSQDEAEEILSSLDSLFGGLSELIENPREYFFGDKKVPDSENPDMEK